MTDLVALLMLGLLLPVAVASGNGLAIVLTTTLIALTVVQVARER